MRAALILAILVLPVVAATHIESTEGTRDQYRCDGGWCQDGQHYELDCGDGSCKGEIGGFSTIINPALGDGAWLADDDIIIGIARDGESRAYPLRVITGENGWEMIADDINGEPFVVTYCPLCQSGVAWLSAVDGQQITLRNSGAIWKFDMVMYDLETGSLWSQVSGEGLGQIDGQGPFHGSQLYPISSATSTWADWKSAYPDTLAVEQPKSASGNNLCKCPPFLARGNWVTGIEINGQFAAFEHSGFVRQPFAQVMVGERSVVAVFTGRTVFVYEAAGRQFSWDGAWLTGSDGASYNPVSGETEDGTAALVRIPSLVSDKGEWLNFHPDSLIIHGEPTDQPAMKETPAGGTILALAAVGCVAAARRALALK